VLGDVRVRGAAIAEIVPALDRRPFGDLRPLSRLAERDLDLHHQRRPPLCDTALRAGPIGAAAPVRDQNSVSLGLYLGLYK
jgi:hypothetical protein